MKTSLSRIIVTILAALCAAATGVAAQATEERLLSGFHEYTRTSLIQKGNDDGYHRFKTEGLKPIERHDFKSKKPVEPKTYLRFSLSVYEYHTPDLAKTAFDDFRGKVEEGFSKSPQYFLLQGERIYWLAGACLYSRQNWDAIELKLQKALLGDEKPEGDNTIKILCGGVVL